jgi:regulator of sigma D
MAKPPMVRPFGRRGNSAAGRARHLPDCPGPPDGLKYLRTSCDDDNKGFRTMLHSDNERRQQTGKVIQELLNERQQLWSLYCQLADMQPFTPEQPLEERLQEFCQLLVDYVSLGHFELYQQLNDGTERRRHVLEISEQVYPRIVEATDLVVDFNDKYEGVSGEDLRFHLPEDLSRLGEVLAKRNELEDSLIEALMA